MNTKHKTLASIAVVAIAATGLYLSSLAATAFDPDAINQPVGYVAMPAVTSTTVKDGNQQLFMIDYSSTDWSGNLHSYDISSAGFPASSDNWSGGAQSMIDQQGWNTRIIITRKDGDSPTGIPFWWDDLSSTQRAALDGTTSADETSSTASKLLNYLRGDSSNMNSAPPEDGTTYTLDASKFRYRAHKLGDIIHSTPVHCSESNCGAATVFVGANDGMLHAINASSGAERFAYVPSMLLSKLKNLASNSYTHNYFVDGPIVIKKIGSQTILAGSLGAGGKGLYALNVANAAPTSETAAASMVLWEITNSMADFTELGNVYGTPSLQKIQTAANTNQTALIVGNGYNGSGKSALYLINPTTGALIKKITATESGITATGLSAPSLWSSGTKYDGYTAYDTAYAGDIDGNLWKFDLVAGTATRLFSAGQAITTAPGLIAHPSGGVMITFATGRLFTAADNTDTSTHYAYGIWDKPSGTNPVTTSQLQTQTLTEVNYSSGDEIRVRVRWASNYTVSWDSQRGWKTALPISGERLVGDGAYIDAKGIYKFVSVNPTANTATKPYGESWWVQLNAMTGGEKSGDPLMDLNKDSLFDSNDTVTVGTGDAAIVHNPAARYLGGGARSQFVMLTTSGLDAYLGNYDKNDWPDTTVSSSGTTATTSNRGVSGGHFDFDIICNWSLTGVDCANTTGATHYNSISSSGNTSSAGVYQNTYAPEMRYLHYHEYDDIYDKTGVDMLNPSEKLDRLSRVVGTNVTTTVGSPTVETAAAVISSVTKIATGSDVSARSYPLDTTSNLTNVVKKYNEAGYPTTAFETLANGNVVLTVVNKSTVATIKPTRKYTDGTYYTNEDGRKRYYTFVDGQQTAVTTTTTTLITYTFGSPLKSFRILVSNQGFSPAAKLTIGGDDAAAINTYNFQTAGNLHTDTANFDTNFPVYTLQTLRYLKFNLPLNGFESKIWNTSGTDASKPSTEKRTGFHPTTPSCAIWSPPRVSQTNGRLWRNGALTIQIVKSTITANDIRMNVEGKPEMGYVLKENKQSDNLYAEYTTFWHHPSNTCYGYSGWTQTPDQDNTSDATAATPEVGSSDPYLGTYGHDASEDTTGSTDTRTLVSTIITINVSVSGGIKTTTVKETKTYSDGSTSSTTTITKQTLGDNGSGGGGIASTQQQGASLPVGRVNWREFTR